MTEPVTIGTDVVVKEVMFIVPVPVAVERMETMFVAELVADVLMYVYEHFTEYTPDDVIARLDNFKRPEILALSAMTGMAMLDPWFVPVALYPQYDMFVKRVGA